MIDTKLLTAIAKGMLTYIPGMSYFLEIRKRDSRHSGSHAEFCYNLWLSILLLFKENGIHPNLEEVGEIGSGGSVGVGICALLSGSERYYALETEQVFDKDLNLNILDELILLFSNKTRLSDKYKQLNIKVSNFDYPENVIKPIFLQENIVEEIRNDIKNGFRNGTKIRIIQNWEIHPALNLDFIFSRAVMEHVKFPEGVYKAIHHHLKPVSYMFHDIELHSHNITKVWNEHYEINNFIWNLIIGGRKYLLNRFTYCDHIKFIESNNFLIIDKHLIYQEVFKGESQIYGAALLAKKDEKILNPDVQ